MMNNSDRIDGENQGEEPMERLVEGDEIAGEITSIECDMGLVMECLDPKAKPFWAAYSYLSWLVKKGSLNKFEASDVEQFCVFVQSRGIDLNTPEGREQAFIGYWQANFSDEIVEAAVVEKGRYMRDRLSDYEKAFELWWEYFEKEVIGKGIDAEAFLICFQDLSSKVDDAMYRFIKDVGNAHERKIEADERV